MLVVGEVVVQRSILLRGHVLEKNRHGNIFDLDGKYFLQRKLLRWWSMSIEQVAAGHFGGN